MASLIPATLWLARLSIMTMSPGRSRHETLLDKGAEALAIHGTVEHTGSGDCAHAQGCDERRRFPMSPRRRGEEAFPARATTIAACHVRAGARFVDEDEAFRVADVEALSSQMGDPMTSRRFIQFGS
jgi:hypothetical protein